MIKQPQRSWTLVKGEAASAVVLSFSLWFIFSLQDPFAAYKSALELWGEAVVMLVMGILELMPSLQWLGWAYMVKTVIQLMGFP